MQHKNFQRQVIRSLIPRRSSTGYSRSFAVDHCRENRRPEHDRRICHEALSLSGLSDLRIPAIGGPMHIERFFVSGLAHASYVVALGLEAVVVDPERNADGYLAYLAKNGLKLRYIF